MPLSEITIFSLIMSLKNVARIMIANKATHSSNGENNMYISMVSNAAIIAYKILNFDVK